MTLTRCLTIASLLAAAALSASALEIESGDSAPERRAAAELKKYISLLSETEPDAKFRIGVKYLDEFPADKAAIGGWDGYAVRWKDGFVYIVSPQPRGCLFGVYDFLERNSDIIWARPDEECGTIYSRTKTFEIREADFVEVPKFQMRGWWFCGPQRHAASEYWHARVRCNFGCCNQKFPDVVRRAIECGFMIGGAAGHNLPEFIPDGMFDTHPEYFAEIGGARRRDKNKTQFCFSNMDGAAVVGSNAVAAIGRKLAKMKSEFGVAFDHWALKQADNQRLCECAACQADIPLGGGRFSRRGDGNFRSNQIFRYLNKSVEVIEKAYPDMRVDTFAYQFSAPPPDIKVHDKFNVAFCPFIKNDRFAVTNEVNAKWAERAEKWSKATKNVMWREYWGCASSYPRQNSIVAAKDLEWINSHLGFTRVYSETVPDLDNRGAKAKGSDYRRRWDASAMEHWVISRLMWNPYVPVERLRKEYVSRTYRKAAAPMRRFYALIAKTWFSDAVPSNYCDDPYGSAARYMVGAGIAKELLSLLDEAAELAKDDVPAVGRLLARQKAHFADLVENAGSPEEPLTVPLVTDGDWSKAAVVDGFVKVGRGRGKDPVPVSKGTRVLVCHDMKNLKVKFVCSDPNPDKLEARDPAKAVRESFPGGDHVEFAITTKKGTYCTHFGVDCRNGRADIRNGDIGFNAKWESSAKATDSGYEVELSVDFESIGAEITMENRFGVCFARMALPHAAGEAKEFSSWKGVHPQSATAFPQIFVSMEKAVGKADDARLPRWISVMPLRADIMDDVCADAAALGNETIVDGIAWSFALHPVGNPPEDKAATAAACISEAAAKIRPTSKVRLGVLLQATMGHGGMPAAAAPFRRVTDPDGKTIYRMCPSDPGFLDYLARTCRKLSAAKPDFFMVDDDTRLVRGKDVPGCFCDWHVAEFGRRTGRDWTRERIAAEYAKDPGVEAAWVKLMVDSLSGVLRTVRENFDTAIPGMICVCATHHHLEYAKDYAQILAAPGQTPVIRGNGAPFHNCGKDLFHVVEMRSRYARQLATIGEGVVLMQEADKCPHTLWMCSATRLVDHMVMTALDGVKGAKIWITRTANYREKRSAEAYRRAFRENRGMMEWAAKTDLKQDGVVVPPLGPVGDNFGDRYLGIMGIPYRFGKARKGEVTALTAASLELLTEDEIDEILSGLVIADASAAKWLASHGRAADIGVDAKDWELSTVQFHELAGGTRHMGLRVGPQLADLNAMRGGAKVLSRLFRKQTARSEPECVAPGAVFFGNARGGRVVSLAQPVPDAVPISYAQTMLTETMKEWFVGLLRELVGGTPGGAHYVGAGPATCLSGTTEKGERILVLNILDLDGDDAPEFAFDAAPAAVERLGGDGAWSSVGMSRGAGGTTVLKTHVFPQSPAIFRLIPR